MILRSSNVGTNSTVLSACFADPALVALDNMTTDAQRHAGAFGAVLALLERARPQWHREAACRQHPDVDFHSKSKAMRARAFTVCGTCSVRDQCLSWSIDEVEDFTDAVLAGTNGSARRRIARNRVSTEGEADE